MNAVWQINLEIYKEIIELAQKHDKREGESIQEEFEEVMKNHASEVKFIGTTDKDIDMLTGDLRENGKKVLNLNEIERRKKNS